MLYFIVEQHEGDMRKRCGGGGQIDKRGNQSGSGKDLSRENGIPATQFSAGIEKLKLMVEAGNCSFALAKE